jgi:cellulose synthase operon protein C
MAGSKKTFRFLILPGLLSLCLLLSSCVYFNTFYNTKRFFKEGQKENEDNPDPTKPRVTNYQKAIDAAARIIENYPKSKYVDDALMIMGKSYYEIHNYPKARRKFEELISNYPKSSLVSEARLWLGRTQIALGLPQEGIPTLTTLWSDEVPESIRLKSQRSLADYYFDQKNYRQALSEYEKILERSKDSREKADIWYQSGEARYALGEYSEAEAAYKKVQGENATRKHRFDAEYKRAVTLRRLGDKPGALKICEALIKNKDYFAYIDQAYLTKAEILSDLGRYEEAEALFKRVIELYPRTEASAKSSYLLGKIYLEQLRQFDKAEEYLGKVQTEKAGSEFAVTAQAKVQDLRYLKSLNRQVDSLNLDLDTLSYQLTWIAAHPPGSLDSLAADSLALGSSDSLRLQQAARDSSSRPDYLAQHGYGRPDQMPERSPSLGYPPGSKSPEMEDPRMQGMQGMGGMSGMQGGLGQPLLAAPVPIRLAPLPTDSLAIGERLNEDQESLAKVRFRLAEHLWFQFDDTDSARVILTSLSLLDHYPDLAARSLLSLYYLAQHIAADTLKPDSVRVAAFDSTLADTLLRHIHERFPDTEFDRWVHPKLGLEPLPLPTDSAAELFSKAENLWWNEQDTLEAIQEYLKVSAQFPQSELAPKAMFAAAWVDEFGLNQTETATALYDSLAAKYPESAYAAPAKRKLTPLPPEIPDSTGVPGDTTTRGEEFVITGPAPTGTGSAELIGGQESLGDIIHKNHLYPQVASEAEISGDVVVRFTVNAKGIPGDFNLVREEPQGFDFGQMATQALQFARFKPAFAEGQYIDGTMTQLVRFVP